MRRVQRARQQNPRSRRARIIIACEGTKTEPFYFNGIRQDIRLSAETINVIKCPNTDPKGIVQRATNYRSEDRNWGEQDQAWAVFDEDEHRHDTVARENWNTAIQLAKSNKIELAISNPAFEFWCLLHFQDHRTYLDRHKARELLERHLLDYEKSNELYPNPLKERTSAAIARAKEMARIAEADGRPEHENPHCGVWRLVEVLLTMKRAE